jgi:hypothetical protein
MKKAAWHRRRAASLTAALRSGIEWAAESCGVNETVIKCKRGVPCA